MNGIVRAKSKTIVTGHGVNSNKPAPEISGCKLLVVSEREILYNINKLAPRFLRCPDVTEQRSLLTL